MLNSQNHQNICEKKITHAHKDCKICKIKYKNCQSSHGTTNQPQITLVTENCYANCLAIKLKKKRIISYVKWQEN